MKIFAIKDKKIGYEQLFNMPNEGAAIRQFGEACKNPESPMSKYPEDYELWCFGEWNQKDGTIKLEEAKCIATAAQYAETKTN